MIASVPTSNPRIPSFLRLVTWVESLVVFAAAAGLFFAPLLAARVWAWSPPPFNSRYVGAVYFAALLPLVVMAVVGRWAPGRLVLWMIFTFTTSIMIVMVFYIPQFEWSRWATWAFWFLYLFLPLNSIIFLVRLRSWAPSEPKPSPGGWLMRATAAVLALYGLALLVVPEAATSFWPWPVDPFHGRIYAATFVTPAVGAWLLRDKGAGREYLVLGLTLAVLGVFSIAGTMWTSATVPPDRQVDYGAIGTILFFAMNLFLAAGGAALAAVGGRPAGPGAAG
jgi:hypothetical protein